jgi:hypothetical protein
MRFERGQEVKEALKIGRKANATRVEGYEIKGHLLLKNGNKAKHYYSTSDEDGAKILLELLEKYGKLKDNPIKEIFLASLQSHKKITPLRGIKDICIEHVRISIRIPYDPKIGNILHVLPSALSEQDLVLKNVLYVMPEIE